MRVSNFGDFFHSTSIMEISTWFWRPRATCLIHLRGNLIWIQPFSLFHIPCIIWYWHKHTGSKKVAWGFHFFSFSVRARLFLLSKARWEKFGKNRCKYFWAEGNFATTTGIVCACFVICSFFVARWRSHSGHETACFRDRKYLNSCKKTCPGEKSEWVWHFFSLLGAARHKFTFSGFGKLFFRQN